MFEGIFKAGPGRKNLNWKEMYLKPSTTGADRATVKPAGSTKPTSHYHAVSVNTPPGVDRSPHHANQSKVNHYEISASHPHTLTSHHDRLGVEHLGRHDTIGDAMDAAAKHHDSMQPGFKPKKTPKPLVRHNPFLPGADAASKYGRKLAMTMTRKSLTNNNEEGENMFEDIFKSETCPHCGEDLYKAKKPKKRHTAQALGNELNPHKGSAAGVQTTPARAPTGPVVDRRASAKRGIVKSEEALFPISGGIRLAVYDNGEGDRALAADIESSTTGGAHGLFIPSARNLEMERKG